MHRILESKASDVPSIPEMKSPVGASPKQTLSRLRPLKSSAGSCPILSLKKPLSMMHVIPSVPSSMKTHLSPQRNEPKPIKCMANASRRHMLPICEQLPRVSKVKTMPLGEQTLLQRMGLGNQALMMRLGLPIKSCLDPTQGMGFLSDLDAIVEGTL